MRVPVRSILLFVGALAISLSGCGQKQSVVKGTVTFQNKPLVHGSVTLMAEDGVPFQGQIEPDGTFMVEDVPYGNYRVAISSPKRGGPPSREDPQIKEKMKQRSEEHAERESVPGWFPIPLKYSQFDQSNLSIALDHREVNFDIAIKE